MKRERRKHLRVEWNSPATIFDNNGQMGRPCVVTNLSNDGARIARIVPDSIPDECLLRVSPRSRLRRCHVVWRSAEAVGIQFADPFPSREDVPHEARRDVARPLTKPTLVAVS